METENTLANSGDGDVNGLQRQQIEAAAHSANGASHVNGDIASTSAQTSISGYPEAENPSGAGNGMRGIVYPDESGTSMQYPDPLAAVQYPDPTRFGAGGHLGLSGATPYAAGPYNAAEENEANFHDEVPDIMGPSRSGSPGGEHNDGPEGSYQGNTAPLHEARRLAQEFQDQHGDPGSGRFGNIPSGSLSEFAGQYVDADDGYDRMNARNAFQAARRAVDDAISGPEGDQAGPEGLEDLLSEDVPATKSTRGRGGRRRGGWRALLKGTEHENVGVVEHSRGGMPTGRGKGRGRGRGRGRGKKAIDPGREFKDHMKLAYKHYIDGDYELAMDEARQAILANPEVFQAHNLLSECLKATGYEEESIQALWAGAQTARSAEVWEMVVNRLTEGPEEMLTPGRLKQAIDCIADAIKLVKPEEAQLHLRMRRFELYKMMGSHGNRGARLDARHILRLHPQKTYIIAEYARLVTHWHDRSEMSEAIRFYEEGFNWYLENGYEIFGEQDDPTDHWTHLNIYLELVMVHGNASTGIQTAKRIARWYLGRKHETFWERLSDEDCEFDVEDDRRMSVPEYQAIHASHDPAAYGEGLPIDIKVKLGHLRLKLGQQCHQEAIRHFRALLPHAINIEDWQDEFIQVAQGLREAQYFREAAEFYDPLRNIPDAKDQYNGLSETVWWQLGTCYAALARNKDAIECFEVVISRKHEFYVKAKARLAKIYEDENEVDKARFLCNELITVGRHDLLMSAGVQMVPEHIRNLSPRMPAPYISGMTESPYASLKELRPAGGLAHLQPGPMDDNANSVTGIGPLSRPVIMPPPPRDGVNFDQMANSSQRKSGKGGRKRKKAGDVNDDLNDWGRPSGVPATPKRPRLLKKSGAPTKAELANRERLRQIQDVQARVNMNYELVRAYWQAMEDGSDEEAIDQWVTGAIGMLDDFTDMKVFFPDRDKYMKIKDLDPSNPKLFQRDYKNISDGSGPLEFLAIPFTEWHRVFTNLALVYAKSGEQDKCYRIIQDILAGANVFFQNDAIKFTTWAVSLYCGHVFNDSQFLIDIARSLIKDSDFRGGEAFQLFASVSRFSFGSNWFSAGPSQKFMLRMVKAFDFFSMEPELRNRFDWSLQKPSLEKKSQDLNGELQSLDAGILLMYGHMVAVANHSFSALPYYYRALALQPESICVNLSIASMWIQNSMKRQTENRQFGISQGLAFMYRYYDLRVASGRMCHIQEAEYNLARMWHFLGLLHLAIPGYERVLGMSPEVQREGREELQAEGRGGEREGVRVEVEDFASEAAFALQGIFALVGNAEAAMRVTAEWMVL